MFVKPKLFVGSLILGLNVISCTNKSPSPIDYIPAQSQDLELQDTVPPPTGSDGTVAEKDSIDSKNIMCYFIPPTIEDEDENEDENIHDENYVYAHVESPPKFPGGEAELISFINKNMVYPLILCYETDGRPAGRVVCRFVVNKDGAISDIKIQRSIDTYIDKEAVRLIQSMPKWIPGKHEGKNVNVYFTLPISFKPQ